MPEEKKVKKTSSTKKTTKKVEKVDEVKEVKTQVEEKVETKVEKQTTKKVSKQTKEEKKAIKEEKKAAKLKEKQSKEEKVKPLVSEAKASSMNIRCTPRKARLVIDLVRGKSVKEAEGILKNLNKAAASPVLKVIKSAEANAINNYNLDENKLYIKEIYATDGMRIKRYLPRAKGSASGLVKRMCHIYCVVKER